MPAAKSSPAIPTSLVTSWGFDSRALAAGRVLRRAARTTATATTSSATRSAPARTSRSSNARAVSGLAPGTGSDARAGAGRDRAGCRPSRGRCAGSAPSSSSSASPGRPARRRPRTCSRPRCRRRRRVREPGVVQQRVRAADHAAQHAGAGAASSSPRWGSGSPATSRRCARSPARSSAIVTNVGLAHAEHLGGPEGVAARARGAARGAPRARARRCSTPTTSGRRGCADADDARTSRRSGYAPDADASDHAMSTSAGRCIPSSRSTAAASGSGSAARTR